MFMYYNVPFRKRTFHDRYVARGLPDELPHARRELRVAVGFQLLDELHGALQRRRGALEARPRHLRARSQRNELAQAGIGGRHDFRDQCVRDDAVLRGAFLRVILLNRRKHGIYGK